MSDKFRTINPDTPYLLPPSLQDWLPENHLARFVVDRVDRLDVQELETQYMWWWKSTIYLFDYRVNSGDSARVLGVPRSLPGWFRCE